MPAREDMDDNLADEPPTSINPYEILEIGEKATTDEIKYAYRKQALKHHPDKAPTDQKEAANKKFQEIAFAYAVLSDERRRRRYDQTGNTSESLDLEDDDFDWASYYKEQFQGMVNTSVIENLKKEYQGSEDEKRDLLKAFEEFKGSMNQVFNHVMLSSILDDEERFRGILDKAVKDGEAHPWPKYVNESERSIKARRQRALKEAEEAKELAEELDIDVEGGGSGKGKEKSPKKAKRPKKQPDESDLAALIQQKQSKSSSFLDRLEAKYSQENGVGSKKKGRKRMADDEPPEEAFAAVGARLKAGKEAKKRKIPEQEEDDGEEEEKMPTTRGRRGRKAKA